MREVVITWFLLTAICYITFLCLVMGEQDEDE